MVLVLQWKKGRNRIFGKHGLLLILFESLLYPFLYASVCILFCFDLIAGPKQDNAKSGSNTRKGTCCSKSERMSVKERERKREQVAYMGSHEKHLCKTSCIPNSYRISHSDLCSIAYAFFAFFSLSIASCCSAFSSFFLPFFDVCVRVRFHLGFRSHNFFLSFLRTILLFGKFPNRFYNATKISNLQKMHISGCSW